MHIELQQRHASKLGRRTWPCQGTLTGVRTVGQRSGGFALDLLLATVWPQLVEAHSLHGMHRLAQLCSSAGQPDWPGKGVFRAVYCINQTAACYFWSTNSVALVWPLYALSQRMQPQNFCLGRYREF